MSCPETKCPFCTDGKRFAPSTGEQQTCRACGGSGHLEGRGPLAAIKCWCGREFKGYVKWMPQPVSNYWSFTTCPGCDQNNNLRAISYPSVPMGEVS